MTTDLASRLVKANQMPWQPIRYPGCYIKTLMVDREKGLLTVLLKMDPGAELPDHEHALVEQTYMLEGRLVDKDGPEAGLSVGPGGGRHFRFVGRH
jgi:anti-sigma factor ChrR (cupin superfamily)